MKRLKSISLIVLGLDKKYLGFTFFNFIPPKILYYASFHRKLNNIESYKGSWQNGQICGA
jgi:hypothetical protein